jgi:hypothetical protein
MIGVVGLTLGEDGLDRLREPGVIAGFALFASTRAAALGTAGPTLGRPSPATETPHRPRAKTVANRAAIPTPS